MYALRRMEGNPQGYKKGLCVCLMIVFYENVHLCMCWGGQPIGIDAKNLKEFYKEKCEPQQALAVGASEGKPSWEGACLDWGIKLEA